MSWKWYLDGRVYKYTFRLATCNIDAGKSRRTICNWSDFIMVWNCSISLKNMFWLSPRVVCTTGQMNNSLVFGHVNQHVNPLRIAEMFMNKTEKKSGRLHVYCVRLWLVCKRFYNETKWATEQYSNKKNAIRILDVIWCTSPSLVFAIQFMILSFAV